LPSFDDALRHLPAESSDLAYKDGQGPIVHLEADLHEVVEWADGVNRRWAFSLSNAGAFYATFCSDLSDLDSLEWEAIAATDFRDTAVKEAKQAEFLVHNDFPWDLVRRIGVQSRAIRTKVEAAIARAAHQPPVEIIPSWYY
jgi:ssDNA thymidine ADP-ribosyltransferase, DarT